jgi:hypothetical protein
MLHSLQAPVLHANRRDALTSRQLRGGLRVRIPSIAEVNEGTVLQTAVIATAIAIE